MLMSNPQRIADTPDRQDVREACVVVVVPTYKHPVFLSEALDSALHQTFDKPFAVIVCSDGCPHRETDLIAGAFAMADPRVVYLRKPNGGPSSARNAAIDYALEHFPKMQALFFLDADNRLTGTALARGFQALQDNPQAGWIYSHIDTFGITWSANYAAPYSPLMHVAHENICDTGSFVRREIFEAGVRFDEDARSGFEDWDFWLRCLGKGFLGKHALFGFSYRQRPESRYREMNRLRSQVIERLRQRHWPITSAKQLLQWEHSTNPRYLLTYDLARHAAFTDPTAAWTPVEEEEMAANLWAYPNASDSVWNAAYFLFGREESLAALQRLGVIHNVLWLMERKPFQAHFAVVAFENNDDEIGVEAQIASAPQEAVARARLWLCSNRQVMEIIADKEDGWVRSLASQWPAPTVYEIRVRGPFGARAPAPPAPFSILLETLAAWRTSDFRDETANRWIWRAPLMPPRHTYYTKMCEYLSVSNFLPRLAAERREIGFVVPVASFGGAEKVAYALARELRRSGQFRTHLFVMGKPCVRLLSEYRDAFDSFNFLADPNYPTWGGPVTIYGESCFLPDAPEIRCEDVVGFLGALDVVVNCQSGPLNSVIGALRKQKIKTVAYIHLTDYTSLGRPAGHPFLTLGFEHAYDLIATCSRQLAGDLHALGVPEDKLIAVANAASFAISDQDRARALNLRARARGRRRLRCLYLGRFDRQKGIERVLATLQNLHEDGAAVEFRLVGAALIDREGASWAPTLASLPVSLEPPMFDSKDLTEAYLWADALLLPSRWEGAPLVIPECQQLGAIPLATRVGAVAELIDDGVDGFLIDDVNDAAVVYGLRRAIMQLVEDDDLRRRMAGAAMARAQGNHWSTNFREIVAWLTAAA